MASLYKRGKIYWVKHDNGYRESCKTKVKGQAEAYLAKVVMESWEKQKYGKVTLDRVCVKTLFAFYIDDPVMEKRKQFKKDLAEIERMLPYIGDVYADEISMSYPSLQRYIRDRRNGVRMRDDDRGKKCTDRTVNASLEVLRHCLAIASGNKSNGYTWYHPQDSQEFLISKARRISKEPLNDSRPPRVISWEEQDLILSFANDKLSEMLRFILLTGARHGEAKKLKWEWERYEPQLGVSYFLIPKDSTKNVTSLKHDRILVLSRKAYDLISSLKGKYGDFVFGYRSISHKLVKPLREKSEVDFRVHDLRHTFGHRLRNAGVTDDDRQNLLGHGQSITAYYSQVGLLKLVNELEKVKRPSVTDLPIQKILGTK
jgi:integrase